MNHHSKSEKEQTQKKHENTGAEIAFAQGNGSGGQRGFGHRKGRCWKCNKEGHHAYECPEDDKNDETKEEEDEKKPPAGKVGTGTTLATHGTSTGDEYNSEDEYGREENQGIMFMTVEISEAMAGGESDS